MNSFMHTVERLFGPLTITSTVQDRWADMDDADRDYLTSRRRHPPPCPWCRLRFVHSPACEELQNVWSGLMSFGKHKGRPVRKVPLSYLRWLYPKVQDAGLREEISRVLAQHDQEPTVRRLQPPRLDQVAGRGKLGSRCECGSDEYVDVRISDGRTRRDCGGCGRFFCFSQWYLEDKKMSCCIACERSPDECTCTESPAIVADGFYPEVGDRTSLFEDPSAETDASDYLHDGNGETIEV